jgi:hypothetical protein
MSILTIAVVIIAVGIFLWAVNTYLTMIDPPVKRILNFVVIGLLIVWLLNVMGVFAAVSTVTVPRVH